MREDRAKRLLSSIDQLPLSPTPEFVSRVRREIIDELQSTADRLSNNNTTPRDRDRAELTTIVDLDDAPNETSPRFRPRRGAIVGGLVAAGLALIAVSELTGTGDTVDVDSRRQIEVAGMAGDDEAEDAFALVEAAYAAHAGGDAAGWFDARFAGAEFASSIARSNELSTLNSRMDFGEQIEVARCEYLGQGDWPAILDSGQLARGHRFSCQGRITDEILRLAGVEIIETIDWVIADGRIIGTDSGLDLSNDLIAFDTGFREWLAENHPTGLAMLESLTGLPELLDLAEQYLAESKDLPRTTESP